MGPLARSGIVSPKAEMVGIALTTAVVGVLVMTLALAVTGGGRVLLVACGSVAIVLSAGPAGVALRRFGPSTRLPIELREANKGAPALFILVLRDGGRARAAVFRGGYALVPIGDPPVDLREVVAIDPLAR